jgi:hypothetical protein
MIKTIGELKKALSNTVFTDDAPICVSVWKNKMGEEPVHMNLVIEDVSTNSDSPNKDGRGFGVEVMAILPDKEELDVTL